MEETSTQTETTGTEATSETTEAAYHYADGVAGQGEKPEWFKDSKYKSVADQAKAYSELESRFGGFTGSPETYSMPEGVDTETYSGLQELARETNMSDEVFNRIVSMDIEAKEAEITREIENLGENGQQRIDNVNDWLKANVSEGLRDMLGGAVQTAEHIEELENFIKGNKPQSVAPAEIVASTSKYNQEGLDELMFATNERGQRLSSVDPKHREKVKAYIDNMQSND